METDQQTKDLNNQLPVIVSREAKQCAFENVCHGLRWCSWFALRHSRICMVSYRSLYYTNLKRQLQWQPSQILIPQDLVQNFLSCYHIQLSCFFFAKNVNIINDDTNDIYILSNKKNKIIECVNMRECSVILFMRMLFRLPLQLSLSNSFNKIN